MADRGPLLVTLSAGAVAIALFFFNVHWRFGGNVWETFKFGWVFGASVPVDGISPNYASGWDGQFYYLLSNDPLGQNPEIIKRLDNPPYRYQRAFIPAVVFFVSRALGFATTPPLFYHAVQLGLVLAGLWVLAARLARIHLSPLFALTWFFGGAVLPFLFSGMLDATADSFFILTLAAFESRKLFWLALSATAFLLVREVYAPFVGGLLLLSFRDRGRMIALMIPLVVVFCLSQLVGWYFAAGNAVSHGVSVSWAPLTILSRLFNRVVAGDFLEILALVFVLCLIASVIVLAWRNRASSEALPERAFCFFVPLFFFLVPSNWVASGIYLRFLGTTILVLLWCHLGRHRRWVGFLLFINVVVGAAAAYSGRDSPDLRYEVLNGGVRDYRDYGPRQHGCIKDLNAKFTFAGASNWTRRGRWPWTREFQRARVSLTNQTGETWQRNHPYQNSAIYLTYRWLRSPGEIEAGDTVIDGQRIALPMAITPQSTTSGEAQFRLPAPGLYQLQVWLVQQGCERLRLLLQAAEVRKHS